MFKQKLFFFGMQNQSRNLKYLGSVAQLVKNLPDNAGDIGSIPGSEPLEEGMATHSSILAWRTPWIEEPGGL